MIFFLLLLNLIPNRRTISRNTTHFPEKNVETQNFASLHHIMFYPVETSYYGVSTFFCFVDAMNRVSTWGT